LKSKIAPLANLKSNQFQAIDNRIYTPDLPITMEKKTQLITATKRAASITKPVSMAMAITRSCLVKYLRKKKTIL